MTKMLVLHGQSMNGAVMRSQLGGLVELLEREVELVFVDAPNTCSEATVEGLYSVWKAPRLAPPHLAWWDATNDGREYRGWEQTRERMREAMGSGDVGLFGFSQGAILGAAIAALAEHGEMPSVRFVISVAGRTPRATVFQAALENPLRTPSLHVWGAADTLATPATSEELAARFDPTTRQILVWPGDHRVPTSGEAADTILRFVRKHGA